MADRTLAIHQIKKGMFITVVQCTRDTGDHSWQGQVLEVLATDDPHVAVARRDGAEIKFSVNLDHFDVREVAENYVKALT